MPGHIRTCVGCRQKAPQQELIRVAATPTGVRVDQARSLPGRGASLHPGCIDAALKGGRIGRALRRAIDPDEAARLRQELERIVQA